MKVVVTHDGKQYVNHLLIALCRQGWLVRFFTSFAANRYLSLARFVPSVYRQVRKREIVQVPTEYIRSFLPAFLLSRLAKGEYRVIRTAYSLFDHWVARQLRSNPSVDLVIGYENSSLVTFQEAKRLGIVTVLDLAQVHHQVLDAIRSQFRINNLTDEQTAWVNDRKKQALAVTDYVLSLSSIATHSLTRNQIDRSRIYEVNLGIDVQRFSVAPKPTDGRFRVLFVGTITYRKGVDLLLQTFKRLNLSNAELTLIGPVGDGEELLSQCSGSIRHIPFLHHEELVHHYQQADVFVFPSYLDSWGQVVLEAMACGTPVVVSENTGAKDAVGQGGGFIVPVGNGQALAEKIQYIYDNRSEVARLGTEARRVAEKYTWEKYYQQIADALTDIAGREGIDATRFDRVASDTNKAAGS
ncbi:glycosyltransferase family 4 protein [Spirosoma rigui]|uniref:glycosyltransferase family 4 protein n=1 Tax=Spirosoma rigui TaxID=564064 RepID=UPI0009B06B01|nr:glycosyltransferase family 4 protein [Spirosoma rigui]